MEKHEFKIRGDEDAVNIPSMITVDQFKLWFISHASEDTLSYNLVNLKTTALPPIHCDARPVHEPSLL